MKTNIKNARELSGKTQKECADFLNITLRAWQGYEQGIREPKFELLCEIADMFNVTLDYLLGREPAPNPFAELGLDEASEQEMLAQYMSFPPEIRATLMDVLIKLADSARPEDEPDEPEEPTPRPSQMVAVCSADLSANSDADEGERKETA